MWRTEGWFMCSVVINLSSLKAQAIIVDLSVQSKGAGCTVCVYDMTECGYETSERELLLLV